MAWGQYLKEENIKREEPVLAEGGNVAAGGAKAEKIQMDKLNDKTFKEFKKEILNVLIDLDKQFKKKFKKPLWKNLRALAKSGKMFSGSTAPFFKKDYEPFAKVKKTVGDIDIKVSDHNFDQLKEILDSVSKKKIGDWKFMGYAKGGNQWNGIIEPSKKFKDVAGFIQLDFEKTDFGEKGDEPSEFAQLGHASDWGDLKKGIKGVMRSYLMGALVNDIDKQDIVIVGKSGKQLKAENRPKMKAMFGFSSATGVRNKVAPLLDDKGKIVQTDGKPTFEKLGPKDPRVKSNRDVGKIFELLFGEIPKGGQRQDLESFSKMLKLMDKHYDRKKILGLFWNNMAQYWAPNAQKQFRGDAEKDKEIKNAAYNEWIRVFSWLKSEEKKVQDWVTEYYEKY